MVQKFQSVKILLKQFIYSDKSFKNWTLIFGVDYHVLPARNAEASRSGAQTNNFNFALENSVEVFQDDYVEIQFDGELTILAVNVEKSMKIYHQFLIFNKQGVFIQQKLSRSTFRILGKEPWLQHL